MKSVMGHLKKRGLLMEGRHDSTLAGLGLSTQIDRRELPCLVKYQDNHLTWVMAGEWRVRSWKHSTASPYPTDDLGEYSDMIDGSR
jgi:hypothetical protein